MNLVSVASMNKQKKAMLSYAAVWLYPITRMKHTDIQAQLARGRTQSHL